MHTPALGYSKDHHWITVGENSSTVQTPALRDSNSVNVQKAKNLEEKSTKSVREMIGNEALVYTIAVDSVDNLVCI